MYAQYKVKITYTRYSKVVSTSGMTGAQVARKILDEKGLYHVKVVRGEGFLSDHYNPVTKVVSLSPENYDNPSVAGTAVAAHEVGHAVQDAEQYHFLVFRHKMVPAVNLTSNASWIFIMIGLFFSNTLLGVGIALMTVGVLFQLVTLPVEFDASKRAMDDVVQLGIINNSEEPQAKKVLSAAAMTYVAATAVAVLELVRLLLIFFNRDE